MVELIANFAFNDEYINSTTINERITETQIKIRKDILKGYFRYNTRSILNPDLSSLRCLIDILRLQIINHFSKVHSIYLYVGIHSLEDAIRNKALTEKDKLYIDKLTYTILTINDINNNNNK